MSQKFKFVLATTTWMTGNTKFPEMRLAPLYENSKFTDLTITFPGHEDVMQAHRLILAMSSPVFEDMFYGPLTQKENLNLPDDPPEAFRWLLEYIYCDLQWFPSVKMAVQVYHLARKYQMDTLVSFCLKYLESKLTGDTLPEMYESFVLFEDTSFLDKCTEIIMLYSSDILKSPHIGQLSQNSLQNMLEMKLDIPSEVTVFNAVLSWSKAQLSKGTEDRDSLRQVTKELLIHVRFLAMTTYEFSRHVLPTGILTPDESVAILMSIKNVKNVKMPAMFSRNRKKRKLCFDQSFLGNITIKSNEELKSTYNDLMVIVDHFTVSSTIYLKSIVDHGNIFREDTVVTISKCCAAGKEIAKGVVIDSVIKFQQPVILTKDISYHIMSQHKDWDDECGWDFFDWSNGVFTYSGKNGDLNLKGDFMYIPGGLTVHYLCFDT